jgi:hypothetical protein
MAARRGNYELDDTETKRVARVMLRRVADINGRHLSATGRTLTDAHAVTCATCHRGVARPYSLEAVRLRQVIVDQLDSERLAMNRREVFYPTGAALALLLDRDAPGWRARYFAHRFVLDALSP